MSTRITIFCDDCGTVAAPGKPFHRDAILLERHRLRQLGWSTTRNSKDFCPTCTVKRGLHRSPDLRSSTPPVTSRTPSKSR